MDNYATRIHGANKNIIAFVPRPDAAIEGYDSRSFTLADHARDLQIILNHLNVCNARIIGWSSGCLFAMQSALMDQCNRISKIILLGASIPSLVIDNDMKLTPNAQIFFDMANAIWTDESVAAAFLEMALTVRDNTAGTDQFNHLIDKQLQLTASTKDKWLKYNLLHYQILHNKELAKNLTGIKADVYMVATTQDDLTPLDQSDLLFKQFSCRKNMKIFEGEHTDLVLDDKIINYVVSII